MSAMSNVMNITLVGVGGQGILLTSQVVATAALLHGDDVKTNEVHGMAQRGGSVISQVRFGPQVYSPLIPEGATDLLVGFEQLEALRYAHFLKPGGFAIVNQQDIVPVTVTSGQQPGVPDLADRLARAYPQRLLIPALAMARTLGNLRATNMVLAGALSTRVHFDTEVWRAAIRECVPQKHHALNIQAFEQGRAAAVPHVLAK